MRRFRRRVTTLWWTRRWRFGQFDALQFQAAGRPDPRRGPRRIAGSLQAHAICSRKIVEYETQLMGGAPFSEYMFIYHVGRDYGGGGMDT